MSKRIRDNWYWREEDRSLLHLHVCDEGLEVSECKQFNFEEKPIIGCQWCGDLAPDDILDIVLLAGGLHPNHDFDAARRAERTRMLKEQTNWYKMLTDHQRKQMEQTKDWISIGGLGKKTY